MFLSTFYERRRRLPPLTLPGDPHFYVNTVSGNNSRAGMSPGDALLTLTAAYTLALATGRPASIHTYAPVTHPLREMISHTAGTYPISFLGLDDEPWNHYATERVVGWTYQGDGVYRKAVTGYPGTLNTVLVSSMTDAFGLWLRLRKNTSTPTTPGEGEFGFTSSTIYIHLPSNANPTDHTIEAGKRNYSLIAYNNSSPIEIEHAISVGGNLSGFRAGNTGSSGYITARYCTSLYAGNSGCFATDGGVSEFLCYHCIAQGSYNDGFNWHSSDGGQTYGYTEDCESAYHWDEGGSPHERSRMADVRGHYHHNGSGGITGVGTSQIDLTGTLIEYNQLTANSTQQTTEAALCFLDSTMSGSLTDVIVRNNLYAGVRINGAAVTVSNLSSGLAQANGLPDVGV